MRKFSPQQKCKNHETVTVTNPDKDHLDDHTIIKRIITEISTRLLSLEDKLKTLVRSIKLSIDENTYNFLRINGSQQGMLYGLAKVSKPNTPLRNIISLMGTFYHNTLNNHHFSVTH